LIKPSAILAVLSPKEFLDIQDKVILRLGCVMTPISKALGSKVSKQPASVFLTLLNQSLQVWHMNFL